MNKEKGFTLLEMIIVVSVLSLLFVLAVPNIVKTMGLVDDKGCKALTKVVDTAIMEYKLEFDAYPGSVTDLVNAGYLKEEQTTCGDKTISISGDQATY